MDEEWRPIAEYEGWYEVSNLGRVRRVRTGPGTRGGDVLALLRHNQGYHSVALCRDGKPRSHLVHRLVAEAFVGPCPAKWTVNHKNGVKTNNRADNLEYCTRGENVAHAVRMGLCVRGFEAGRRKSPLTASQVSEIRRLYGEYTQKELAKRFGVGQTAVSCIVRRKRWKVVP